MEGVITADIINSREVSPDIWLNLLKDTLQNAGVEHSSWEVYRGDSIQVNIKLLNAL